MRAVPPVRRHHLALTLALMVYGAAYADTERSASIPQVAQSATMAERSSAAFDQISTVESGRSGVAQIDPALAEKDSSGADDLAAGRVPASAAACHLTPEQQSIVTSLEAQGRLPAGDCEMVAWFAEPADKSEAEDPRSLAESVVTAAPDLLGREAEADRQSREAEALARAEAAAAAVSVSIFAPPPGQ